MRVIVDKNPKMKETFSVLRHISADDKIRMAEEHRRIELSQYNTDMNFSFEKGMENGIKKGIKKGMEKGIKKGMLKGKSEGKREAAFSMKRDGLPSATIAKYTGLSIEEIEKL